MTLRWSSLDTLPVRYRSQAEKQLKPRRKYGNVPIIDTETGEKIDSKKEAKRLAELRQKLRCGELRWLATQVELRLSETVKMYVDFLYCDLDGVLHWEDSKGHMTKDWRTKQRLAKDLLGIEILTS